MLLDVERVAPCLPGAAIEGHEGDDYSGTMKVKIGPITASYKGTVKIEEADEAARRAVMRAQARDSRGQGTAAATITSTMEEVEGGTRVHVETDMRVTGPAAQFGRGVMQDVSAKLMGRFADCLAEEMAGTPRRARGDRRRARPRDRPEPPPGPAGDSAEAAARPVPRAAGRGGARPRRGEPRSRAQARRAGGAADRGADRDPRHPQEARDERARPLPARRPRRRGLPAAPAGSARGCARRSRASARAWS